MSEDQPLDERLFEEATDLVIRLQNDPSNPVALEMVQQWRARSPAHEEAWAEVAEIYGMAGSALKRSRTAERRRTRGPTRRNVIIGLGAGIGALAVGNEALPWAILSARADHITGTGEIARVPLPDGSIATLGPDSAIGLDFTSSMRRVDLLAGMSYFEVATPAAATPFEVRADAMSASAASGGFDVSIDDGYVSVGVDRGSVELAAAESPQRLRETIAAGNWLSIASSSLAIERAARDASQIGAWRDGMIVAERETVSSVVARIARWLPGRVVLADPRIAERRVNGVFDLTQPVAALQAVVHPFGGKVHQLSRYLTIIAPV